MEMMRIYMLLVIEIRWQSSMQNMRRIGSHRNRDLIPLFQYQGEKALYLMQQEPLGVYYLG
jgi:hypothetical protein